ncbi:uncharacterized protein LOC119171178 [Rhipicephalus microplus]|uniref:uncharacterized protein LOC119171178 n=1 Tax=Rhipicephalus microplus TaxID=6941 RepID=UPI003F6B3941
MRLIFAFLVLVTVVVTNTSALPPLPPLIPPALSGINDLIKNPPIPHCIKIFFLPHRLCWSWENDLSETLCSASNSDTAAPASSDSGATGSQSTTGNNESPQSPSPGSTILGSAGKSLLSGK